MNDRPPIPPCIRLSYEPIVRAVWRTAFFILLKKFKKNAELCQGDWIRDNALHVSIFFFNSATENMPNNRLRLHIVILSLSDTKSGLICLKVKFHKFLKRSNLPFRFWSFIKNENLFTCYLCGAILIGILAFLSHFTPVYEIHYTIP